jgi:hypothetical protein
MVWPCTNDVAVLLMKAENLFGKKTSERVLDGQGESRYGIMFRSGYLAKRVKVNPVDCKAHYVDHSLGKRSECICVHQTKIRTISRSSNVAAND